MPLAPEVNPVQLQKVRLVTIVRSADSIEIASDTVPVYETKPGSIILPGLSGIAETIPVFID